MGKASRGQWERRRRRIDTALAVGEVGGGMLAAREYAGRFRKWRAAPSESEFLRTALDIVLATTRQKRRARP